MRAGERAGINAVSRIATTDDAGARVGPAARRRPDDAHATSTPLAIVFSLFLALIAAALLAGGHVVIDPLLRSAAIEREAGHVGAIVYTMPDGIFCRHLSFDNATAELTEGAVEKCPNGLADGPARAMKSFAWGGD